jgi:raffinose/stachyose/melibiose transport system permease protein
MTTTTETASSARSATPARGLRRRGRLSDRVNWPLTSLAAVLALTVLIPLYLTVITALKTPDSLAVPGSNGRAGSGWKTFPTPGT